MEQFTIIYDGEALASHEFDVRELAPALLGIADLLEETNKVINGDKARVQINVKGNFKTGSFPIDFNVVQDVFTQLTNLFNQPTVQAAVNLIEILGFTAGGRIGLLKFIRWLKGREIKQITKITDTADVKIELKDGDNIQIPEAVIGLFSNLKVRQSLETVIFKPLSREGIGVFKVKHNTTVVEITKEEKDYFTTPELEDEIISTNTVEKSLQLLTISFVDGNKWRFSDGSSQFYAEIKDDKFVEQVKSGITSFAIDDIFRVKLKEIQKLTAGGIRAEFEVLEVIDHRSGERNLQLPLVSNE